MERGTIYSGLFFENKLARGTLCWEAKRKGGKHPGKQRMPLNGHLGEAQMVPEVGGTAAEFSEDEQNAKAAEKEGRRAMRKR